MCWNKMFQCNDATPAAALTIRDSANITGTVWRNPTGYTQK